MINNRSHSNFSGGNVICDVVNLLEHFGIHLVSLGKKRSNEEAAKLAKQALLNGFDQAWKEGLSCRIPSILSFGR